MKTKTTITVETYRFSTVRLSRERDPNMCAGCGREISPSKLVTGSARVNVIASDLDTQRIKKKAES